MKCPNCQTDMDMVSMPCHSLKPSEEKYYLHFSCPGANCFVEFQGTVKRELSIFEETGSIGYGTSRC